MPDGHLDSALQRLESALATFRSAYEAWLRKQDAIDEGELRTLLADAELRLDEARQALARAEGEH